MTTEKFPHLDNIDPNVNSILKIPIDGIENKHLLVLRDNLSKYSRNTNLDISRAAVSVIGKIDDILNLGRTSISGEIMDSVNNFDYIKKAAS